MLPNLAQWPFSATDVCQHRVQSLECSNISESPLLANHPVRSATPQQSSSIWHLPQPGAFMTAEENNEFENALLLILHAASSVRLHSSALWSRSERCQQHWRIAYTK